MAVPNCRTFPFMDQYLLNLELWGVKGRGLQFLVKILKNQNGGSKMADFPIYGPIFIKFGTLGCLRSLITIFHANLKKQNGGSKMADFPIYGPIFIKFGTLGSLRSLITIFHAN